MSNLTKNPVFQLIIAIFAVVSFATAGFLAFTVNALTEVIDTQESAIVELETEISTAQTSLDALESLPSDVARLTSVVEVNSNAIAALLESQRALEEQLASQSFGIELPELPALGEIDLTDLLNP